MNFTSGVFLFPVNHSCIYNIKCFLLFLSSTAMHSTDYICKSEILKGISPKLIYYYLMSISMLLNVS